MQNRRLERLKLVATQRQSGLVVVLEDVHDPHNADAIFRTCDAFGIQSVYLIFEKEAPWNPKKIGKATSSSANKWLDFTIFQTTKSCIDTLAQNKFTIVATTFTSKATQLWKSDFIEKKIALCVGNEKDGISPYLMAQADRQIYIPMLGMVQSLNVSVATALCLAEITRQRSTSSRVNTLDTSEVQNLLSRWSEKA